MARTPLLQRLLKLTSMANEARKEGIEEIEFAEQNFFTRRKFLQSSPKVVKSLFKCRHKKKINSIRF